MSSEPQDKRPVDFLLLGRLLVFGKPYWKSILVSALLLPLIALAQLAQPYLVKVAIDDHIAPGTLEGLGTVAALYVGLLALHFVASAFNFYVIHRVGQWVIYDIRQTLFAKVARLEAAYFDTTPTGRTLTRFVNDVESLGELFTSGLVSLLADILLLTGIVGTMFWLSPELAIVTLLMVPPLFFAAWFLRLALAKSYREMRTRLAVVNSYLNETLTGIRVVHLFARESLDEAQFDAKARDLLTSEKASVRWDSILSALVELVSSLSIAAIIWYGGGRLIEGAVSFGLLVAFIEYIGKFFGPIKDLSAKYTIFQSASAACEKVFGLLDEPAEIVEPNDPQTVPEHPGTIRFEQVSFAYRSDQPVLKDVSLSIEPGTRIGIVGPTGAGKSTVVKLLCRHYHPTAGRILLGERSIEAFASQDLQRTIGLVPQDVFLFADTIANNIGLGNPSLSPERIEWAARSVEADRFIDGLPEGLATRLTDRGSNLSAGQRQLLAFARVLAHDPKILILDEATSSIDHETEAVIQRALHRVLEGRTALVIAHRLSTLKEVDRILVFENGALVEEGTDEELRRQEGIYARFVALQMAPA